jgi:hypothetical protein
MKCQGVEIACFINLQITHNEVVVAFTSVAREYWLFIFQDQIFDKAIAHDSVVT